jgi:hypothetical protein
LVPSTRQPLEKRLKKMFVFYISTLILFGSWLLIIVFAHIFRRIFGIFSVTAVLLYLFTVTLLTHSIFVVVVVVFFFIFFFGVIEYF